MPGWISMDKIRSNFRHVYAEGCDVLGGGAMMLQALPPPCPMMGGWERTSEDSFFSAEYEKSLPDQMFNFKTNGGKNDQMQSTRKIHFSYFIKSKSP